jgi:anhydro-N-acetylmuramic acid kinase
MSEIYIGLMSGTSVDGIDAIAVDFETSPPTPLAWHFSPFDPELRRKINNVLHPDWHGRLEEVGQLDALLGEAYAACVNRLMEDPRLSSEDIQAIGSHGQTVSHAPDSHAGYSMQLGDPNRVAEQTGIKVIADFRRRDIAAGGQGAPLVPAFHREMFYSAHENRVILNIGGIANITRLSTDRPIIGFDTGPGNTLMNEWILKHQGTDFDEGGAWAASGKVDEDLLAAMLDEPYFGLLPPKSTGRELFNLKWLEQFHPVVSSRPEDVQATLVELSASTIALGIEQTAPEAESIYVCGGGAYNKHLMARLKSAVGGRNVASTSQLGIEPDRIEAMAFAWLARQTLKGLHGNLPDVTGARSELILGGIYQA